MSAPVIVHTFTAPGGEPFSLTALDANIAAIVAAINALAAEPLLQLGVTPGVSAGYMPVTGGTFQGQITAPSILVGPVAGPQYDVVTTNSAATTAAKGIVKMAAAVADLAQAISNPPTQAEVTAIQNKINALLAALRTAGELSA